MSVNEASMVNQNSYLIGKPVRLNVERPSRGLAARLITRNLHDGIPTERRAASTCSNTPTSVTTLPCLSGGPTDTCDPQPPSTCFDPTSSLQLSSSISTFAASSVPLSTCSAAGFCSSIRSGPGGAAAVASGNPAPPHACPRAHSRSSQPNLRLQGPGQPRPQRRPRPQASLPGDLSSARGCDPTDRPQSGLSAGCDAMSCRDAREVVHCTDRDMRGAVRMDDLENWVQYLADQAREDEEEAEGDTGGQAAAAAAYDEEARAAVAVVGTWVSPAVGRQVDCAVVESGGDAAHSHSLCNNSSSSTSARGSAVPGLVVIAPPSASDETAPSPPSGADNGSSASPAQPADAPATEAPATAVAAAADVAVAVRAGGTEPDDVAAAAAPAPASPCDRSDVEIRTMAAPKPVRPGRSSPPVMQSWPLLAPTLPLAAARTVSAGAVTGPSVGCSAVAAAAQPTAAAAAPPTAVAATAAVEAPAKAVLDTFVTSRLTDILASAGAPADVDVVRAQQSRMGMDAAVWSNGRESGADEVGSKPAPLQRRRCQRGYVVSGPTAGADAGWQMSTAGMAAVIASAAAAGCGRPDGAAAGAAANTAAATARPSHFKWPSLRMIGDAIRPRCRVRHHGGDGGRRDGAVQQRRGAQRRDAPGRILWTEAGYDTSRVAGGAATRGPAALFTSYVNYRRNTQEFRSNCNNNNNTNVAADDDDIVMLATNGTDDTIALRYDSFGSVRVVGGGGAAGMSTFGLALTTGGGLPVAAPGQILTFSIAAMAAAAARHDAAAAAAAAAVDAAAASLRRISLADGDWDSLWTGDDFAAVREPLPRVRQQADPGAPPLIVASGPLLDMPYGWEAAVAALAQELGARGSAAAPPPEMPVDRSRARLYELSPRCADDPRVSGDTGGARKAWRRVRTGLRGLIRGLKSCYS